MRTCSSDGVEWTGWERMQQQCGQGTTTRVLVWSVASLAETMKVILPERACTAYPCSTLPVGRSTVLCGWLCGAVSIYSLIHFICKSLLESLANLVCTSSHSSNTRAFDLPSHFPKHGMSHRNPVQRFCSSGC